MLNKVEGVIQAILTYCPALMCSRFKNRIVHPVQPAEVWICVDCSVADG